MDSQVDLHPAAHLASRLPTRGSKYNSLTQIPLPQGFWLPVQGRVAGETVMSH